MIYPVKRALVSVFDKNNIVGFCQLLTSRNVEILSTGGTAKLLTENDIPVIEVSDYTQFPEIMDGRVKTLHPKVHGGILARRGQDDEVLEANDILPIDLVVTNLYPFESVVSDPHCDLSTAIENIDIGGPTMLRAAAKNYQHIGVVVDPSDYQSVSQVLVENQNILPESFCFKLAQKVFSYTTQYDGLISNYLSSKNDQGGQVFPQTITLQFSKRQNMRYGENPHQHAAFYASSQTENGQITNATQMQGKALSYNNIADIDAALRCIQQFNDNHCCVIVKHTNPCGVAIGKTQLEAYEKAYRTDPESAFGGIIAFNNSLQADTTKKIIEQQFVEVIVAPEINQCAQSWLSEKNNVRVLECGDLLPAKEKIDYTFSNYDFKRVMGGLLVQSYDSDLYQSLTTVSDQQPSDEQMLDLLFAWKVSKQVKSNAIVYAANQMTIGIGAGQMSRVNSARIASVKARHNDLPVMGAVMASDAFFPFRDGVDQAANSGIKAIIQPGGSVRDDEVIDAANEYGIAMVFTFMRHFRH